jgi:myosin-5
VPGACSGGCFHRRSSLVSSAQEATLRVVAAILHLGNIEFMQGPESDLSKVKEGKSNFHLQAASELLMCDSKGLLDSLCTWILATRDGNITVSLDVEATTVNRDTRSQNHLLPLVCLVCIGC